MISQIVWLLRSNRFPTAYLFLHVSAAWCIRISQTSWINHKLSSISSLIESDFGKSIHIHEKSVFLPRIHFMAILALSESSLSCASEWLCSERDTRMNTIHLWGVCLSLRWVLSAIHFYIFLIQYYGIFSHSRSSVQNRCEWMWNCSCDQDKSELNWLSSGCKCSQDHNCGKFKWFDWKAQTKRNSIRSVNDW